MLTKSLAFTGRYYFVSSNQKLIVFVRHTQTLTRIHIVKHH